MAPTLNSSATPTSVWGIPATDLPLHLGWVLDLPDGAVRAYTAGEVPTSVVYPDRDEALTALMQASRTHICAVVVGSLFAPSGRLREILTTPAAPVSEA